MSESLQIEIQSIQELSLWLDHHFKQSESVWLVRFKKGYAETYITYKEIVDVLLCFGWIDSLPRKLSESQTILRISPRSPKSNWSKVNKERVAFLDKAGLMKESGYEAIRIAKERGTWDALNGIEELQIPYDLMTLLKSNPQALFYFENFSNSSKRGILEWIVSAKKTETRRRRVEETVTKAAQNLKANHPKGRDQGSSVKFQG